ncbi:MAG TPA: peroxiredoxin [Persephonella sp.]|uniref:thioredoxin-dependent peroxiredoxin n=1 Tax=Persephonella marina (strain DSM 14350 / EX-H1) TaxID=123214 RepID=C0QTZ2_PERMH|nr:MULTISPECIES: peroxiredoxin [Persephonella]ACO04929.1 bacterioferritin comigratory protein BCP [Persephonella marina EX-H1]HCB70226.1 peroxiredoxin [Persephonella sp.]
MVKEGDKAPDFCLEGLDPEGNEKEVCLKDLLSEGKYLVLYFYPKDNTPGCTTEACDFRDNLNVIGDKAVVAGVSPDSIKSHKKFKEKYGLNFYLLSDPEKNVLQLYDAYGEKKMYGKVTKGVIRSTYIISPEGKIVKKWKNVKAKGHVQKVVEELERLIG